MMQKNIPRTLVFVIVVLVIFLLYSAAHAYPLPDTGQTDCYSTKVKGKVVSCPPPGDPNAQDGSYATNLLSYTINADGTALDMNTNLMWQRLDDGIMRTWTEAENYCAGLNLGGHTDWRLPSKRELIGIVHYGLASPAIDRSTFPDTKNTHYWTSSRMTCSDGEPWSIDFSSGNYHLLLPSSHAYARCVRGGRLPFAHFVDNGNGTVSDLSTGLIWQQNERTRVGWPDAIKYCETLSFAGHSDWRVPNIKEYESLTHGTEGPSIMADYFNMNLNFPSWSSTTYLLMPDYFYKWTMNHDGLLGICSIKDKNCKQYGVRCVRGQHQPPLDEEEIGVSAQELTFWYANDTGVTTQNVIISNKGTGSLVIGSISPPSPPFFLSYDACSNTALPAFTSCSITILFDDVQAGYFTDTISIPSNDADRPVFNMNVKGSVMDTFYLSDTGQAQCYSGNGTSIGCPLPGTPTAQDGSYETNQPSFSQYDDGTVRDNNSSIMWQQEDDGLMRTWDEAASYCGNLELGGYTDWRFPTMRELSGIANYGRTDPAIDLTAFPSTKNAPYWSSSSSDTYKDNAWYVNFSDGTVGGSAKSSRYHVRCARGAELPLNTLLDNADGTSTDLLTGLMWEQGDATATNWEAALALCEGLSLAGYTDWRLPNIRELTSLLDIRYRPAINYLFFPQVDCSYWSEYWSSTSSSVTDDAYVVDFFNGHSSSIFQHKFYNNYNVRCVRGGAVKLSSTIAGTVTDLSTGLPVPEVQITVTDSAGIHSTVSDSNGVYELNDMSSGSFTAIFEKACYTQKIVNGTFTNGQTMILDIQIAPLIPPSITITVPADGSVFTASPIEVMGHVSADALVTVNGLDTVVNDGVFSASVSIQKGINTIIALATDSCGRTASDSIEVALATQGSLNGQVTDSLSASPLPAATVSATDSLNAVYTTQTGLDGKFILSGIESGSYILTITKDGYRPYTVSGILGSGEIKTINAALTKLFSATTLGDYGNVTVMEVIGNYDAKNPDGSLNTLPRQEIAKEFLRTHPDDYDFLIVFSNFDYAMPEPEAEGFYLGVKNDTQGIGKTVFDQTASFGSNGNLQGMIDMGNVVNLITDPSDPVFEDTINILVHELMHRWGAYVHYKDSDGSLKTDLLGKDLSHWSYLLDSAASLHYGNAWRDNGNGTFTSAGGAKYCSPLDLYLMGFIDKSEVPPMLLIENPAIDPSGLPAPGVTVSGSARQVTIDAVIAAEGERIPAASSSQKVFKAGFLLITSPDSFAGTELQGIENLRTAWSGRFSSLTGGKGSIADVVPSLTVLISSPVEGDAMSDHVTVKGAFINSTGLDTGVTVNGIPAAVYGNQFIVNNVPLADGINTITANATDSSGRTATDSIILHAIPNERYIRLQADIDTGIAPLELVLTLDSSFNVDQAEITVTGPSQPDFLGGEGNEYLFSLAVEGIYTFTAHVIAENSEAYQDSAAITVMNPLQIDTVLKRKWDGMKQSLSVRDFDTAATFFTEERKTHYHDIFMSLDAHMPQIVKDMQDIERIYIRGNSAKYRIRKDEFYGGQVVPITHNIYFAVDNDGLWRIDWY